MTRNRELEHKLTDLLLDIECNIVDTQILMMNLLEGDKKKSLRILMEELEKGIENKWQMKQNLEVAKAMSDEELDAATKRFLKLNQPSLTTNQQE